MGYMDEFYAKENIIGYTGSLKNNPTVYFADTGGKNIKLKTVNGREQVVVRFGHITQAHSIANNVGRELVRECYSYSISNDEEKGEIHAHESVYGADELEDLGLGEIKNEDGHSVFHISRTEFMPAVAKNLDVLAEAINNHTSIKGLYILGK